MISISNLFFNIIYKNFAISNNNNNIGNNNNNDNNNNNEKAKLNKITVIMKSLPEIVKIKDVAKFLAACIHRYICIHFFGPISFLINILGKKQKPKKKS